MMSTPIRRSRSITKKERDKCSPAKTLANPNLLSDLCVDFILRSTDLAGKAALHLPRVYAQYILCLALKRLREGTLPSSSVLHQLIASWPYSELSFEFRSNPVVIKNLGSLQPVAQTWSFGCIEPHVYYGIHGVSKSRYSNCAREIAVGLFNHVYYHDRFGSNGTLLIQSVDLSDFEQFSSEPRRSFLSLNTESATTPFYQLIWGEFPGRDAYECLSPDGFLFYRTKKPTLQKYPDKIPIKIYVNFKFTSEGHIEEFNKASKLQSRYKLYLKSLDLGSMKISHSESKQLDQLDTSELETLITSSRNSFSNSFLANISCLWILQEKTTTTDLVRQALKLSGNLKILFVSLFLESCSSVLEAIAECSTGCHSLQALGLLAIDGEIKNGCILLTKCLKNLCSSLQYLQLYGWTPSTIPLESFSVCHNLRVLSIVVDCSHIFTPAKSHSVGELFETLGNLEKLEFIELGEQVDLQAPDLVRIQSTLRKSLPLLEHCHLHYNYISLVRADLDNKFNEPIFQLIRSFFMTMGRGTSLLYRQSENFHLTLKSPELALTKRWLNDTRHKVCYKIGAEVNSISSLTHLRTLGMCT